MFFRRPISLVSQIRRQVFILSLIAVIGVLGTGVATTLLALFLSQEDMSAVTTDSARDFDLFLNSIENDLQSVGNVWPTVANPSLALKSLLSQNPGILEITVVDPNGNVVAHRHRSNALQIERVDDQPWLNSVMSGGIYVGEISTADYGVPLVNIAVPFRNEEEGIAGSIVARVDLTTLWSQVIAIKVGDFGYGYLADSNGRLLVYSNLEKVQEGVNIKDVTGKTPAEIGTQSIPMLGEKISIYKGMKGDQTIGVSKALKLAPWYIVAEQSVDDAMDDYLDMMLVLVFLILIVIVLVYAIFRFVRRSVINPLREVNKGLTVFSSGDLDYRLPSFQTTEMGDLSTSLNQMAGSLKESQAEIQEINRTLESRVAERTRDMIAVSAVSQRTATILDVPQLLQTVCDLTKEDFRLYHAHIYLLDKAGEYLTLNAGAGDIGRTMATGGHRIAFDHPNSLVASAARSRQVVVVGDVRKSPNFLPNPLLPDTRSELAVALVSREQLMGVLDVQSSKLDHFGPELVTVMETLARQIAGALSNARLFTSLDQSSRHDQALSVITQQIQGAVNVEEVLQVTARELGKALRMPQTVVELHMKPESR